MKEKLLGYSKISKAYRVYNYKTLTVEETINVRFNDKKPDSDISELDKSFTNMDIGAFDAQDAPKDENNRRTSLDHRINNK